MTRHRLLTVGSDSRDYDNDGNLMDGSVPNRTNTFDDRNRLVHYAESMNGWSASYDYNGRGERVMKNAVYGIPLMSARAHFVYDEGGQLLTDNGNSNPNPTDYIYADGRPVALVRSGTIYYVHSDQLGTPRVVTAAGSATPIWNWAWQGNPFGEKTPTASLTMNLRLPGQYYDAETGLVHNGWRDDEPGTGRYVESDPVGLKGGISTYSYVGGNPLSSIDPFGLWVKICSRLLHDKNSAPTGTWHPFRHDYLDVSGTFLGFTPANEGAFWGPGRITGNEQDNGRCSPVCNDNKFDQYVLKAARDVGEPTYCPLGEPGLPGGEAAMGAGAINCHTWVRLVLQKAIDDYLAHEKCPTCFK